jgi:superfamily II DNA or RNA helicase
MAYGAVILDEAHHSISPTYRSAINYFCTNPELKVLGITATPDRGDKKALGQVFETVAFDYEILNARDDGWLVPVLQQFVTVGGLDFSQIRTTAGDLNASELSAVMEAERICHLIAGPSIDLIGKRPAIGFAVSVKQAEAMAEVFNRYSPGIAQWICGKTDKDKRAEIIRAFKAGELQVLWNVGCLTEGFDSPSVAAIIQARPTKSRALYAQMSGRCMRPLPGLVDGPPDAAERRAAIATSPKPDALMLDFVGNSGRHKLVSMADILGGKYSTEAVERAIKEAKKTAVAVEMTELMQREEEAITLEREERRQREAAKKARLLSKPEYTTTAVNPFGGFQLSLQNEGMTGRNAPISLKQRAFLLRQGVNPDQMHPSMARRKIGELIAGFKRNRV